MQVSSPNNTVPSFPSTSGDFDDDFSLKLNLNEEQEEEFSFVCTNPDESPISADDIFQNGQIRPVYPLFNRDLLLLADDDLEPKNSSGLTLRSPLKKLFVEEVDRASSDSSSETEEPEGPYCNWTRKAVDVSPEACKKSNSTGFSKLRRFRGLVLRSNSEGKDAFVFLHHDPHSHDPSTITATTTMKTMINGEKSKKKTEEKQKPAANKRKNGKKTTSSAHERLYVRNRELKEENKRKSYLPYRVGFFTNVNGLSRNLHPY